MSPCRRRCVLRTWPVMAVCMKRHLGRAHDDSRYGIRTLAELACQWLQRVLIPPLLLPTSSVKCMWVYIWNRLVHWQAEAAV